MFSQLARPRLGAANSRSWLWAVALGAALSVPVAGACPGDGPLRVLVPYAAGGSMDATTRVVAEALPGILGRPVLVVNVPGASGLLAVRKLLGAPRDGCTLLAATVNNVVLLPLQNINAGFEPTDLQPVARVGGTGMVFVASMQSGLHDIEQLQRAVGAGRTLSAGHPGVDSLQAHALNLLAARLQTRFVQVPYSGAGTMVNDLAGGHIDIAALAVPAALPLARIGKATVMDAVRGPDGVPVTTWSGWFAARDVPVSALASTRRALLAALDVPAVARALQDLGVGTSRTAHASFSDEIAATIEQLRRELEFAGTPRGDTTPDRR